MTVVRYFVNKLFFLVVSIVLLATATFFLMKAIPGNPFMSEKNNPVIQQKMIEKYGLDKPVYEQYLDFMGDLARLDFGLSMKQQHMTVNKIIGDGFSVSLQLGIFAIIVALVLGLLFGLISALNHRKFLDVFTIFIAVLGVSIPSFVAATGLQYVFAIKLQWVPVSGIKEATGYILPTLALATLPAAFIARLTRSNMLEVLSADYIKTARSKGLTGRVIMLRHALRNAVLPVVTYLGPLTANVITGSVVVERIFAISGLGKFFVNSITNRDYTLIMGLTIFYGIILMVARFLTDIAYGLVDPRIKFRSGKEG